MFIAVDGIDGAGKTTLVNQLAELLEELDPLVTKEPTDKSEWGMRLKESAKNGRMPKVIETEYFHKDRLDHLRREILPALQSGRPVITDRYVDSTLAYQCHTPSEADALYEHFKNEILVPNLTFILDCPVEEGLHRINRDRNTTSHFEVPETLQSARKIFESRRGPNYRHLKASGTVKETFQQAVDALLEIAPSLGDLVARKLSRKKRRAC